MANSGYRVTKRINDPMVALIFDADQLGPAVILAGVGNILQMTLYGFIAGAVWFWFSGYIKRNFPKGYLFHRAWWYGFLPVKSTPTLQDPMKREFFG